MLHQTSLIYLFLILSRDEIYNSINEKFSHDNKCVTYRNENLIHRNFLYSNRFFIFTTYTFWHHIIPSQNVRQLEHLRGSTSRELTDRKWFLHILHQTLKVMLHVIHHNVNLVHVASDDYLL